MVQFNTRANEILLKLVYYGPGLSGKTTNLQMLHAMCHEGNRGELFSVNTQEDRTLFFDLLPINLGYIYGNAIHLQIYTVPGQVQYDASRRVVLNGADGVVFVADSSESKMQDNVDSLSNLYHNLNANRLNIKQIPFVIQYNKRDLPDAMPVGVMNRRLNFRNVPYFESTAHRGVGVLDTLLAIVKETVATTFRRYHLDKKIRDFDEMLRLIESNIQGSMRPLPEAEEPPIEQPEHTVLRHSNVSVTDLPSGRPADPQELLEDALKSNMETARLYSELKQIKDQLERKNEETNQLYLQLEKANQDNLKTRRYLEGLVQSVGEAIVSFGQDGRILTWNVAAERMFGLSRSEIVGHSIQELTPEDRQEELQRIVSQVAAGIPLRNLPSIRLRKGGQPFPCTVTYAPIRGGDDRLLAISAVIRDLEEQKTLEKQLRETQDNLGLTRVMPMVVNETSNRLAGVLLSRGLLQESQLASQPPVHRLLHAMDGLQSFLKPLQLVLSPSSPSLGVVGVNALLQAAIHRVEAEATAAGVALDMIPDTSIPDLALDAEQMQEGLVQLLRHRILAAASSQARRVRTGTRMAGGTVQLIVQDTGAALPEQASQTLFQLAHARSAEDLSLCITSQVLADHGGRISVRSQEGVGNAFLLELPAPAATPVVAPARAGLEGCHVMVVDDESFLLECITDAVTSWGCKVTACEQAQQAIQHLQNGGCDLIISDIRMPGLSGIQFYDWIKTNRPELARRILYTTGDAFDPETRQFLTEEQVPHLGKPFDLRRLKGALEELLG